MAYINRENFIQVLAHENSNTEIGRQYYGAIYQKVMNFPTADVVEVKHGRWLDDIQKITTPAGIEFEAIVGYKCSLCGRREGEKEPYCNCGAKMDVKKDGV